MHARQPLLVERRREARVVSATPVTQGLYVRAILFDPYTHLISVADGSVTGDNYHDVVRHPIEQLQCSEVILDGVCGFPVEQGNQDIRKQVACDEHAALLDEQRRMARGMSLVLNNPNRWAIPGNLLSVGG